MDHIPSPRELRGAARACTFLAYTAGLAGVAAGTLMLREGNLTFAVILWTTTFAVGAALMGVSVLVRAVSGLSTQITRMESRLQQLADDRARTGGISPDPGRDPWLRH
jgi:choline-glycine betaine transporter